MLAKRIDGLALAKRIRADIAARTQRLLSEKGWRPSLAVIVVGANPASEIYVRNKRRVCEEVGVLSLCHKLPAEAGQGELASLIARLNADPEIDGILLQLPLPSGWDVQAALASIDPAKDVDGFHPENTGRLALGLKGLAPCTPRGAMLLLHEVCPSLHGKRALVVGRSNIVGKPMALMLLQANCTVTMAHSRTHDLARECLAADIVIAALGKPRFIEGSWIKEGAVVIDVGINRVESEGTSYLTGDVDYEQAALRASAITPVPGGVGPMTIACLMQNTLEAALARREGGAL